MESSPKLPAPPWFARRWFQAAALLGVVVALAGVAYVAIWRRDNDFLYHRTYGQCFLSGSPHGYQHYPIGRGLINALTAWLPYRVDRALHYVLAVAALTVAFFWWNKLGNLGRRLSGPVAFGAAVFTVGLGALYLLRDLEDCGLQLGLLFFLTAAAWSLKKGSAGGCGFWLGLAATYKVTPVIFFPFLVWKRQWRAAGWMAFFVLALNIVPALHLGWSGMIEGNRRWFHFIGLCLAEPDPSATPIEPPNHRNQSLNLAIARFLQTYPPDHPLALRHPAFFQVGNLDCASAKRGVRLVLLLLGASLAWRWRRPWGPPATAPDLANEWAAVTLLCALVSPLCWLQHLVLVLPALFLWLRAWLAGAPLPRWQPLGLAGFALVVLLVHRDPLGNDLYHLLMSYKLHTFANLAALAALLNLPSAAPAEGQTSSPAPAQACSERPRPLSDGRQAARRRWSFSEGSL